MTARKMIRRATPERLTELARGIVRGDYLVADGSPDWMLSLAMMGDAIIAARNLGIVLVPVDAHLGGYWINGRVPGVTVKCTMVAKGDIPELERRVETMRAALWPEEP